MIIGAKRFARRMWAYLTHDAKLSVVAFAVHRRYLEDDTLLGLPVVAIEDLPQRLDPAGHDVCVAAGHLQVNRVRASLCEELEACGYRLLRYVATTATCWQASQVGERNVLILDRAVVAPFATVGDDVVLNTCNVNHDVVIEDHSFVATGATIGGEAFVGAYSFIGLNAVVRSGVRIAPRTVVGAGAVVKRDTQEGDVLSAEGPRPLRIKSWELRDPF